ncbi:MAG TPA: histone deacetylase [Bryobacteraceae bacterium]|nr:histone deacetylase [Bryobacteraceae bacterium]
MTGTSIIYHDGYDLQFGDHVFPSCKYKMIRQKLIDDEFCTAEEFQAPEPADDEDLLRVHTGEWVRGLKHGTLSYAEILRLEVPYSQQMVKAFWLAAGGTILAARQALQCGTAFNIGGGFHHAFAGHGEGFCAIHDVAVAIRKLQHERVIQRAMTIDCDVHHGNGTAALFSGDASVFTMSIHQYKNYPSEKPPSTIDIHLRDGVGDAEYLEKLGEFCRVAIPSYKPDILFYVAGADPYADDQLGGLNLSIEGLQERDRLVVEHALRNHAPVAIVLAGGYARRLEDTVAIHANTAYAAEAVLKATGYEPAT